MQDKAVRALVTEAIALLDPYSPTPGASEVLSGLRNALAAGYTCDLSFSLGMLDLFGSEWDIPGLDALLARSDRVHGSPIQR